MAARIESTTTIARPVDDVFQFLLHLDEHPTDAGVESVARTPDGPVGPGTTLRFNHGNGRETTMRFTSVEPNRRIGFEGHVGPLRPVRRLRRRAFERGSETDGARCAEP